MYRVCERVRKKNSPPLFYSSTLDKFQVDFALTDTSSEALSAPKIFLGRSRARIFHRLQNAYNKFSRGRERCVSAQGRLAAWITIISGKERRECRGHIIIRAPWEKRRQASNEGDEKGWSGGEGKKDTNSRTRKSLRESLTFHNCSF